MAFMKSLGKAAKNVGGAVKQVAGKAMSLATANKGAEIIKAAGDAAKSLGRRGARKLGVKAIASETAKSASRAAMVGSLASASIAKSEAQKSSAYNTSSALDLYNKTIGMIGAPAEGTGAASTGNGSSSTVYPVGN